MLLLIVLAGFTLFSFFAFFFVSKCSRESYLLFNAWFLPLMSLGVTSQAFGSLQVFDALAWFCFFFFLKDFIRISADNKVYFYLFNILLLVLFAGSLNSDFLRNSLLAIVSILPVFIFSRLLVKELSVNPEVMKKMIRAFQFSLIIAAVFMGMQMAVGTGFTFYRDLNPNVSDDEGIRYPGFFMDAQINAQFLGMLSFLFLVNFKQISKPRPLNYLLFCLAVVTMFFSGGRSGFLGFAVGFCFLFLWMGWRMRYFVSIAGLAVLVALPFAKQSFLLFQRMNTFDDSYNFRAYIWKEAYEIFLNHKILGIGVGNYQGYIARHASDQYYTLKDNTVVLLDQPENGYLKILTEFGIIGFVISILLIIIPVIKAIYLHLKTRTNYIAIFFIASIICWLVSFNSLYTISDKRIVILLASLICFLIKLKSVTSYVEENDFITSPLRNRLSAL